MNRICEEVQYLDVFAPQAVATATKKTSTFVDTAGADSVEFLIYTGALTSGKKLTVASRPPRTPAAPARRRRKRWYLQHPAPPPASPW